MLVTRQKTYFSLIPSRFGMLAFGSILLTTATESQPFLVSRYRTALCSSSFNFISAFVIPWRKKHLIKLQCDQWLYGCQANFVSHRRKRNCYKYSPCVHVGPYWHVQCTMLSLPQTPKRHKPQGKCGRNITITSAKGLHLKSRVYLEAAFHFFSLSGKVPVLVRHPLPLIHEAKRIIQDDNWRVICKFKCITTAV